VLHRGGVRVHWPALRREPVAVAGFVAALARHAFRSEPDVVPDVIPRALVVLHAPAFRLVAAWRLVPVEPVQGEPAGKGLGRAIRVLQASVDSGAGRQLVAFLAA